VIVGPAEPRTSPRLFAEARPHVPAPIHLDSMAFQLLVREPPDVENHIRRFRRRSMVRTRTCTSSPVNFSGPKRRKSTCLPASTTASPT
jgi:hypothetical protein